MKLREQIEQSEKNLQAQHQVRQFFLSRVPVGFGPKYWELGQKYWEILDFSLFSQKFV